MSTPPPAIVPPVIMSPYLTTAEAAEYCRVSVKTVYNAKCLSQLKSVAGSRRRPLYLLADLDRWIRGG